MNDTPNTLPSKLVAQLYTSHQIAKADTKASRAWVAMANSDHTISGFSLRDAVDAQVAAEITARVWHRGFDAAETVADTGADLGALIAHLQVIRAGLKDAVERAAKDRIEALEFAAETERRTA